MYGEKCTYPLLLQKGQKRWRKEEKTVMGAY